MTYRNNIYLVKIMFFLLIYRSFSARTVSVPNGLYTSPYLNLITIKRVARKVKKVQ